MAWDSRHLDDFTIGHYKEILTFGRRRFNFIGYGEINRNDSFLLWRHDVDLSLERALALARLEHAAGIKATYFIHLHSLFYNALAPHEIDRVRAVSDFGHDIGLHFDPAACGVKDHASLAEAVACQTDLLNAFYGCSLTAVSFHNPTEFSSALRSAERISGLVNCSSRWFEENIAYCSDSNGYWRHERLLDFLMKEPKRAQVLTHPGWWLDAPAWPRDRLLWLLEKKSFETMQLYDELLEKAARENIGTKSIGE